MHGFHIVLASLWQEWRERIYQLVRGVHRRLPPAEPMVTLHARELDPVDEGIGVQFQLTCNGDFYGGRYQAAYFIIQIQLIWETSPATNAAAVIWRISSLPALQRGEREPVLLNQQRAEIPVTESQRLRLLFEQEIAPAAASFFARVRAGLPVDSSPPSAQTRG